MRSHYGDFDDVAIKRPRLAMIVWAIRHPILLAVI